MPDELAHTVLDEIGFAVIDDQTSEPIDDVGLGIHLTGKPCPLWHT
jgi:hypothetical protein